MSIFDFNVVYLVLGIKDKVPSTAYNSSYAHSVHIVHTAHAAHTVRTYSTYCTYRTYRTYSSPYIFYVSWIVCGLRYPIFIAIGGYWIAVLLLLQYIAVAIGLSCVDCIPDVTIVVIRKFAYMSSTLAVQLSCARQQVIGNIYILYISHIYLYLCIVYIYIYACYYAYI